eukprot:9331687-Pyramimonas_sp.AAC.2
MHMLVAPRTPPSSAPLLLLVPRGPKGVGQLESQDPHSGHKGLAYSSSENPSTLFVATTPAPLFR